MSDDFSWSSEDTNVVIQEQPPIAVYTNPHDAIVIRMNGDCLREDDQTIFVRPENVLTLIKALAREAGMGEIDVVRKVAESDYHEDYEVIEFPSTPVKRPLTNAERQKRYRDRHRNDERNEVTELPLLPVTNGHHAAEEVLRLPSDESKKHSSGLPSIPTPRDIASSAAGPRKRERSHGE
jgi:hypothetical protein